MVKVGPYDVYLDRLNISWENFPFVYIQSGCVTGWLDAPSGSVCLLHSLSSRLLSQHGAVSVGAKCEPYEEVPGRESSGHTHVYTYVRYIVWNPFISKLIHLYQHLFISTHVQIPEFFLNVFSFIILLYWYNNLPIVVYWHGCVGKIWT